MPRYEPMMIEDREEAARQVHDFNGGAVRRRFNPRSEEVWDYARSAYADGLDAGEICRTYALARSTFFDRARAEGWLRRDLAAAERPEPLIMTNEDDIAPKPAPPAPEMAERAWRLMAEALERGRANEAKSWMKIARELRAEARREETDATVARWKSEDDAVTQEVNKRAAVLDSLDSENGVQPSRRARRRLAALEARAARSREQALKQVERTLRAMEKT